MRKIIAITVLFGGLWSAAAQDGPAVRWDPAELEGLVRRFAEVYSAVEENAADPVNSFQAIYGGAIPGMLKRLDPHSIFFDPDQFEQLKQLQTATQKGFGSVVSILPGRVFVLQTLPGTPSARAGMQPGDEILAINGIALDRLSIEQLVALLMESRKRPVRLDIRRPGSSKLVRVTMSPATMKSESVDLAFELTPGIGYVRVKDFEADTGRRVKEAIEELGGAKLRGLVLDLRGNRGGIMAAALETAALFLEPGSVIVSVRGRSTKREELKVPEGADPYGFKIAVLVDEESASGAEIVAAALQDHGRAKVVGAPTFGKGLVQQVYPLSDNTGLALTTAYYFTPSGRSIQRPLNVGQLKGGDGPGGIQPDYVVYPEPLSRLRIYLEASGAFPTFAGEVVGKLRPVEPDFEVSNALLDEFQGWLIERRVQPTVAEWSTEREWIRSRLRQEIFNLAIGVKAGDRIEIERDPRVRKALEILESGG